MPGTKVWGYFLTRCYLRTSKSSCDLVTFQPKGKEVTVMKNSALVLMNPLAILSTDCWTLDILQTIVFF